jgi:hypothetical protein
MSACFRTCVIGVSLLLPAHAAIAAAPVSLGDRLTKLAAEMDIVILYTPDLVVGRSGRAPPPGLPARANDRGAVDRRRRRRPRG